MQLPTYNVGLDIGSTTLKIVFIENTPGATPHYTDYRRHQADVPAALTAAFKTAREKVGACNIRIAVTGSAGMGLAERCQIPFIQEVVAAAEVVNQRHPDVRTLIDIGGEDAKMIFFHEGRAPDIRMNGSCAGGTGAFIDQMAALLNIPVQELGPLAEKATHRYPIASRCGVFSKTDVQNLMARKAAPCDIAASVLDAVALQVITTLSRGFDVAPRVLFCGGVLAFNPALRATFRQRLQLADTDTILPENAELFPATGCAIMRDTPRLETTLDTWLATIETTIAQQAAAIASAHLQPLFADTAEREHWKTQIARHALPATTEIDKTTPVYLGIDSGSTTTKIVLIDNQQRLLWTFYSKNNGDPLATAARGLRQAAAEITPDLPIAATSVTGYGEDLLKAAFNLDYGLVETMAHFTAARKFHPRVSFILDIGGQDMKAAFIRENTLHRLEINEACSSGCGSFIESFATSLNIPVAQFANMACEAAAPADLGTRCTVFMNSKVKQSLREGATPADIAAGLSYSVIKNCLHKVLRLRNTADLGDAIVVQGGTFRNDSIARAFEKISGRSIIRPDKPELMGAYGAALYAQQQPLTPVQIPRPLSTYGEPAPHLTAKKTCPGCENTCSVTLLTFDNGNEHHFGNQCEKVFFGKTGKRQRAEHNLHSFKYGRLFPKHRYAPPAANNTSAPNAGASLDDARRTPITPKGGARSPSAPQTAAKTSEQQMHTGAAAPISHLPSPISHLQSPLVIGIPRALGFYENFPFWRALLEHCGITIQLSAHSNHDLAAGGLHTVMSDNICYPAKLMNGHIQDLIAKKVTRILLPHIVHERKQSPTDPGAAFNCPIVSGYADVIRSAINPAQKHNIALDTPTINLSAPDLARRTIIKYLKQLAIPPATANAAFDAAWTAQEKFQNEMTARARHLVEVAENENRLILLLAGRPYHNDPLVQHKIADAVTSLGAVVITEDIARTAPLSTADLSSMQWAYTHRILSAARWVANAGNNIHFVQLTSFGCGLDPFITESATEILAEKGKNLTLLKVDDVNNIGSLRLRLRSLIESLQNQPHAPEDHPATSSRHEVHEHQYHPDHTILVPFMSEFYSPLVDPMMKNLGYKVVTLPPPDTTVAEYGIQYANNEVCYPATIVVGSMIKAVASGKYDPHKIAFGITQTGGQCRASSYIDIIRRALKAAGYGHIPVLPIAVGETLSARQPAFNPQWRRIATTFLAGLCYGDNLSQLYHAAAPREKTPGQAATLRDRYMTAVLPHVEKRDNNGMVKLLRQAAADYAEIIDPAKPVPAIGIVGEIYVKLNAFSQNNVVNWLVAHGIEPVLPPVSSFFMQHFANLEANARAHITKAHPLPRRLLTKAVEHYFNKIIARFDRACEQFPNFRPHVGIHHEAKQGARVVNLAAQFGEGWLIPAEILEMLETGIHNIVSLQPFGCIANHVVAKGTERRIRELHPEASLLYLDFDSSTGEANILNRLHFLVRNAKQAAAAN